MKIEKLLTLSQFIDYLDTLNIKEFCKITGYPITMTDMEWTSACFHLTKKYNDFLKQPLKKEMFVNEIEKPDIINYEDHLLYCYEVDFKEFQESEKKVIFVAHLTQSYLENQKLRTLDDLSRHSNLELKNVEI